MQHLDEGTIHAWLDGALGASEASAAEAHVQTCGSCAQAVAEARGLVAASSRILAALDDVPIVRESARKPLHIPAARPRSGWWWHRAGVGYAAAATALLAVGTTMLLRSVSPDAAMDRAASPAGQTMAPAESESSRALADAADANRNTGAAQPVATRNLARDASSDGARARRSAAEPQAKKDELAIDRIVPLPGEMPRAKAQAPAPPPSVRQEDERKAEVADMAAKVAARGALVQGRVLDAATGAPVAGAIVSIDTARIARTDSAGRFQLRPVPLGAQTVSVRAIGFQAAQHPLAIAPSDSVDLGFALQKSSAQLQSAVVTGASAQAQTQRGQAGAAREEAKMRRDSIVTAPRAASPVLQVDGIRANAANVLGCYTLRAVAGKQRDADDRSLGSMPSRVQLEAQAKERAYSNEMLVNRARTLAGVGRAESWRFVGDSLEVVWTDDAGRHVLRFVRREARWTSDLAVMESCPTQ